MNDSFYSGMTVSLTCQYCGLESPQRLILPLRGIHNDSVTSQYKMILTVIPSTLITPYVIP